MSEISRLDLAWEAVSQLGELSRRALGALEGLGAKSPQWSDDADQELRSAVRAHGKEAIADLLGKITEEGAVQSETQLEAPIPVRRTFPSLIQSYKADAESGYFKLRHNTRLNYENHFERIEREIGDIALENVTSTETRSWYARWSGNGERLPMGHSAIGMVRMLLRYGARTLEDKDCIRLNGALSAMRFKKAGTSKVQRITAEHALAIRRTAHKMGLPSIALATALLFELNIPQRQVIGEWVPKGEPGASDILCLDEKWIRGLRRSDIDSDMILHVPDWDGESIEIDLNGAPMVLEELAHLTHRGNADDALVLREKTHLPWQAYDFRRNWRKAATAAGVPNDVRNASNQGRKRPSARRLAKVRMADPREGEIWAEVSAACKSIPKQIRDDVAQDLAKDVLSGDLALKDLERCRSQYVKRHLAAYNSRRNISLDQPVRGSNISLIDIIPSDDET